MTVHQLFSFLGFEVSDYRYAESLSSKRSTEREIAALSCGSVSTVDAAGQFLILVI